MNQNQVREFHDAFGQPARYHPTFISEDEVSLRINLLDEEFCEAIEAMNRGINLQHIAKELADVIFVAYGAALHYGIDLDRVFDEVAKSNMSKLIKCPFCFGSGKLVSFEVAVQGMRPDGATQINCHNCSGSGKVKAVRGDGKVLKGPDYVEPDLSFIPKQQRTASIGDLNV